MNYSLYFVSDEALMGNRTYKEVIPLLIQGGITVFQLRQKTECSLRFYETAKTVRSLLKDSGIPLIINDRVDIALAVGADGVHLGQDDLPCDVVRAMVPDDFIIGISAASVDEVRIAEECGADYIGAGSIYSTSTKPDAGTPIGCQRIRQIRTVTKLPIVGIGGITLDNASEVFAAGANGIAVISAILNAPDIEQRVRQLRSCQL